MPFPKNVPVVRRPVCGKTDTSSEKTTEPYDGATQLTSCVDPMPSAREDRRYTIHDSPEGSMVIMVGSSPVEDRVPLPSSRENNPPEGGMSPARHQITFTCTMLDGRTQRPCGKSFSRRTDLKRHQNQLLHVPGKRDFQCAQCSKKYVHESWLQRHMRKEHGSKENGKDGSDSGHIVHPDSGETDHSTPQTNTHGQGSDQNGTVHPDGDIPPPTKQEMARKRTFLEIIDLEEMPDEEIERHRPKPRRDDKSVLGPSTSKYVKGIDDQDARQQQDAGSAQRVDDPGSRASGTRNANPEVQTGRVEGRNLRPRIRQPAGPSGDASRHPSHGSTTTVSRSHGTDGGKSSDKLIDDSLPPHEQPGDSDRTELTCKLVKSKTGKVCNKVISRTNAKWAKSALHTHQNSSVHRPEKRKAFKCDKCDSKYSYPEDLRRHKRKVHGVGVRVAVVSDEESETSVDEQ